MGACWSARRPELAGLIEVRGLGIRRLPYEPVAVVGLVVDLAAPDGERLPARGEPAGHARRYRAVATCRRADADPLADGAGRVVDRTGR